MQEYYVLGIYDNDLREVYMLHTDPITLAQAKGSVRWQESTRSLDYPATDWRICKAVDGKLVDQQGQELVPKQGSYTDTAWAEFQDRVLNPCNTARADVKEAKYENEQ